MPAFPFKVKNRVHHMFQGLGACQIPLLGDMSYNETCRRDLFSRTPIFFRRLV